jgi:hypothetical protein
LLNEKWKNGLMIEYAKALAAIASLTGGTPEERFAKADAILRADPETAAMAKELDDVLDRYPANIDRAIAKADRPLAEALRHMLPGQKPAARGDAFAEALLEPETVPTSETARAMVATDQLAGIDSRRTVELFAHATRARVNLRLAPAGTTPGLIRVQRHPLPDGAQGATITVHGSAAAASLDTIRRSMEPETLATTPRLDRDTLAFPEAEAARTAGVRDEIWNMLDYLANRSAVEYLDIAVYAFAGFAIAGPAGMFFSSMLYGRTNKYRPSPYVPYHEDPKSR